MAAPISCDEAAAELYCARIVEELETVIARQPVWSDEQIEHYKAFLSREFRQLFLAGIEAAPSIAAGSSDRPALASKADAEFTESLSDLSKKTKKLLKELTRRRRTYPTECVRLLEQRQECEHQLLLNEGRLMAASTSAATQESSSSVGSGHGGSRRSLRKHARQQQRQYPADGDSLIQLFGTAVCEARQVNEAINTTIQKLSNNATARDMMAATSSGLPLDETSPDDSKQLEDMRLQKHRVLRRQTDLYSKRR